MLLNALARIGRAGLTRLYFDRRRALLALESHPDKHSPEAFGSRQGLPKTRAQHSRE
jgi:hypothetical protein